MNICTVIPARGGSKSIPKKNIKLLHGKPLIQYSIEYSLKCPLVGRTVVSTDSEEIAKIAKDCKAEVPFIRPVELARDDTEDFPVFKHALTALEDIYKQQIDIIVLLRPTSPFRPAGLIEKGVDLLRRFPQGASVRSVAKTAEHPYRQWKISGDFMTGYETGVFEPYNIPRQKLPPVYFQTGDIEIIRRGTILNGSISGDHILPLVIDHADIVDIDSNSDWKDAQQHLKNKGL